MSNELYQHKRSDTIKWILTLLAFILVGVMLAGIILGWFEKKEEPPAEEEQQTEEVADGMMVSSVSAKGLKLAATATYAAAAENSDAPVMADKEYTLTVTPDPVTADDTYTWTATDTDKITLTPAADTKSCKVTCNEPFGTQITVTVTSKRNADVSAFCMLDYVKEITGVTVTAPDTITFDTTEQAHKITLTPTYGVGTITPDTLTVTGGSLKSNISGTLSVSNSVRNPDGGTTIYSRKGTMGDFSFSGDTLTVTTPAAAFIKSSTTSQIEGGMIINSLSEGGVQTFALSLGTPTVGQLNTAFNNSFKTKVDGEDDGELTVNYTYSHNGVELGQSSVKVSIGFDCSALIVNAVTAALNQGSVIFY